ncbi:MAG: myristoyl transferase [Paenibacillus sp. RIFOXYA1_FULL_44_5]|nr:MAG: myristoyl transferase [Paenibacillus sp. RIFOXYA1_FULL_44_5]
MENKKRGLLSILSLIISIVFVLTACGTKAVENTSAGANDSAKASSSASPAGGSADLKKVKIQLKWVPQAQFAGIYVAKEKGFYKDEGIDAEIIPGGPDIIIEQQVANGVADLGITAVDSLLVNQDNGLPLVSVAQILQKSSNRLIAKKSTGIDSPEKMKGKRIGSWMGSQQFQVLAFLEKNGLNPKTDIQLVKQGFTMDQFFNDQLDVASASIYNEYHVVLENGYKESDLNVFNIDDAGVAMLEDTLIAKTDWLKSNRELAVKAVRATLKGWQYAIEHQDETIDIIMKQVKSGSTTREHQAKMLKEMAKLILPDGFKPEQIGSFQEDSFKRTADIAYKYHLIKKPADLSKVYDKSIWEDAMK